MAPEGTMHADAGRTRSQVRPELEARMMAGEPRTMNMIEAINSAMDVMLGRDDKVVVMGEDVGFFGGVLRATAGLQQKNCQTHVFEPPEKAYRIIGVAVGMRAYCQ